MNYLRKLKIQLVKGEFKNPVRGQIRDPQHIYKVFRKIKDKNQETLIGVYLADNLEVNAYDILAVGSSSEALIRTDEIFNRAIITRSRNFILVHNHPSGNPAPSPDDLEFMKELHVQSRILHRTFLDFIIVGDGDYWSMFDVLGGGEYTLGEVS